MIALEVLTHNLSSVEKSPLYPAIPDNHEGEIEEFILPREGEVKEWDDPNVNCGDTRHIQECPDDPKCDFPVVLHPWDCQRYECPVCWESAVKKGAMRVRNKVRATLELVKIALPSILWFISSVIVNAPPEVWGLSYEEQHAALRKALKSLGALGVVAIYHRWRYRDVVTGEIHNEIPWKEYQKNPDRYKRVLGVHWHCFMIGKILTSPEWYKLTGFTYKKKKSKTTKSYVLTDSDVYRIAYYALTHCAISTTKNRNATHYYGVFWRSTILEKWYEPEPIMCPKCNRQRVFKQMYHNMYGDDCYGLKTPAVKMIVHRKWALRGYPGVVWIDWNSNDVSDIDLDSGLDFSGVYAPVKKVEVVNIDEL